ncbi:MAG: ATP-binding cassette domain-containing protein [Ancrocorticia sp.]|nr:ATP-binding cassette domain-containing protein [Ancrocorticia sp.]
MAYIELVDSTKRYHMGGSTIMANDQLTFSVNEREFAVVLGASGAGKSTVLNILGGMDTNDDGQVIVDGLDIATYNAKQLTT